MHNLTPPPAHGSSQARDLSPGLVSTRWRHLMQPDLAGGSRSLSTANLVERLCGMTAEQLVSLHDYLASEFTLLNPTPEQRAGSAGLTGDMSILSQWRGQVTSALQSRIGTWRAQVLASSSAEVSTAACAAAAASIVFIAKAPVEWKIADEVRAEASAGMGLVQSDPEGKRYIQKAIECFTQCQLNRWNSSTDRLAGRAGALIAAPSDQEPGMDFKHSQRASPTCGAPASVDILGRRPQGNTGPGRSTADRRKSEPLSGAPDQS